MALTDLGITEVAQKCNKIKSLFLSRCAKLTNECIKEIGNNLKSLVTLDLYDCKNITSKGIYETSRKILTIVFEYISQCPLEYLNLRSCVRISSEHFDLISKQLKYLNLRGVSSITGNE
jgi:hypothetical protein